MTVVDQKRRVSVALIGNPNSGKTSLSNRLARAHDTVGNYPRVTVEKKSHPIRHKGLLIDLTDLPGVYSLTSQSPDEKIARDHIQDSAPDIVVNVIDAGNLMRSLFLSTQLIEMGRPRIYVLNMMDEVERQGLKIDVEMLSSLLGGPVVVTVARRGLGTEALLDAIVDLARGGAAVKTPVRLTYDSHLEVAIRTVEQRIAMLHPGMLETIQSRWLAIKLLEGDDEILRREKDHEDLMSQVEVFRHDLERTHGESVETMLADVRYGFAHGIVAEVSQPGEERDFRRELSRRLDGLMLHRVFGLPIFLGLLWVMFEATFTLGAYPMDWINSGVTWLAGHVEALMPPGLVRELVVDGIIAGMGGTIIFLPNVVILFFFMALLSETGYLTRSAFLLDRIMHVFGLHGKAFIPLVMGFGCNVPAILATRTIESERMRLITILINPFITCSARLPVFILFSGAFFAEWAGTVVFLMYVTSIAVAMAAAVILAKTVLKGATDPFVMELPPYRMPTAVSVLYHMWERAWGFVRKVTGVILVGSIIIWFLQAFPRDLPDVAALDEAIEVAQQQPASPEHGARLARLIQEQTKVRLEQSYLGRIAGTVQPVWQPLGFGWMESFALLTGFVAKEVVVASYAVLFAQGDTATAEDIDLRNALAASMTPAVAFGFMTFILLYSPCLSTIAVIRRETRSWRWTAFSVVFSFVVAYVVSFIVITLGELILGSGGV